ncbi:MAG: hypothetical protein QOE33_3507 [Acidobacteriota bacterium]|nr:hypothetical protein [Acidobacteriota bacterium]
MSAVKELLVESERKWQAAVVIAKRAGELKRCELCEELTEEHSKDSLKKAYAIGNSYISANNPLTKDFKNSGQGRRELTDILENLWTDFDNLCKCQRQALED